MDWKDIIKETGIEVIWVDKDYSKSGSFIAKCPEFPHGAIVLGIGLEEIMVEPVVLHEIGHLVAGTMLTAVNNRLKCITHNKNEAKATRYLIHSISSTFVSENEENLAYATASRLLEHLHIAPTFENIQIAEQEINIALENQRDLIF
ncbi:MULTISPECIES: hypothetical protein [Lactococcus]|uniref:hypothetical protein n=1 Tax=Lactococcus TaxID=1357 RepID=UPI00203D7EB5|nr:MULTISPECIES: hypothetical protein [Lactococcus]